MKASIIKIGNSQGIRIPKAILSQCGFEDEVEFSIENNTLVIKPVKTRRKNWDAAFAKMAENGDDLLIDADLPVETDWDEAEWEWK